MPIDLTDLQTKLSGLRELADQHHSDLAKFNGQGLGLNMLADLSSRLQTLSTELNKNDPRNND